MREKSIGYRVVVHALALLIDYFFIAALVALVSSVLHTDFNWLLVTGIWLIYRIAYKIFSKVKTK